MKDVTMLIAHCDDELLFGWPMWDRVKRIVCASSDRYNPARQWCKERGTCLREAGEAIGAEVIIHDNDSEFYRAETRGGSLKRILASLLASIEGSEVLFTHNAFGEYMHIDHLLCHQVGRMSGLPMLVTDIAHEINWAPVRPYRQGELVSRHTLDRARFDELKAIYDKRGCWTWSWEPVAECGVYRI